MDHVFPLHPSLKARCFQGFVFAKRETMASFKWSTVVMTLLSLSDFKWFEKVTQHFFFLCLFVPLFFCLFLFLSVRLFRPFDSLSLCLSLSLSLWLFLSVGLFVSLPVRLSVCLSLSLSFSLSLSLSLTLYLYLCLSF